MRRYNARKDFVEGYKLMRDTQSNAEAEIEKGELLLSSGDVGKHKAEVIQAVVDAKQLFITVFHARMEGISMKKLLNAINTVLEEETQIMESG